jgi:hypothetical protein
MTMQDEYSAIVAEYFFGKWIIGLSKECWLSQNSIARTALLLAGSQNPMVESNLARSFFEQSIQHRVVIGIRPLPKEISRYVIHSNYSQCAAPCGHPHSKAAAPHELFSLPGGLAQRNPLFPVG